MGRSTEPARTYAELLVKGCFLCHGPHWKVECPRLPEQYRRRKSKVKSRAAVAAAQAPAAAKSQRSYAAAVQSGSAVSAESERKDAVCNCRCNCQELSAKIAQALEDNAALQLRVTALELQMKMREAASTASPMQVESPALDSSPLSLQPTAEAEKKNTELKRSTAVSLVSPRPKPTPAAAERVQQGLSGSPSSVQLSTPEAKLVTPAAAATATPKAPVTPGKRRRDSVEPEAKNEADRAVLQTTPKKQRSLSEPRQESPVAPAPAAPPAVPSAPIQRSASLPPSPFNTRLVAAQRVKAFPHLPKKARQKKVGQIREWMDEREVIKQQLHALEQEKVPEELLKPLDSRLAQIDKHLQDVDEKIRASPRCAKAFGAAVRAALDEQFAAKRALSTRDSSVASIGSATVSSSSSSSSVVPPVAADASANVPHV